MRIELPSWEVAPLSRRRKRQTKKNGSPSRDGYRAHAFVRNQRGRSYKKARTDVADDVIPLLVLTSESKIEVVGIQKGELSVSQNRQYACRPGTTFLPKYDSGAPFVAAVMDKRNDLIYALQNENKRLVCWPSLSDSLENAVHTSLTESAVTLDVMPSRFSSVFGTLQGHRKELYLASFDQGERKIDAKTFDAPGLPENSQLEHVATTVQVVDSSNNTSKSQSAGKRKSVGGDSEEKHDVFQFIQVFASKRELYVVRHEILSENESNLSSFERRHAQVHKVPLYLGQDSLAESTVSLVGESGDSIVLSYRTGSGSHFLVSFSSKMGKVVSGPFEIDANAREISLINPHVAISQVDGDIVLLDTLSGAVLQKTTVPHYIRTDKEWRLLGLDSRRSRLIVLFRDENEDNIASANVSFGEMSTSPLASRLLLALESQPECSAGGALLRRQCIPDRDSEDGGYTIAYSTKIGLQKLELAFNELKTGKSYTAEQSFVAKAYSDALVPMVAAASKFSAESRVATSEETKTAEKPQNYRLKNGTTSGKRTPNGHRSAETPRNEGRLDEIPPSLVVGIGAWAARILSTFRHSPIGFARDETRVILKKVVRSKKASARHLFDSSGVETVGNVLKGLEIFETEKSLAYSPVDFLFDIFAYCSDVSERHMVSGIQYMLVQASADDIAKYFEAEEKQDCHSGHSGSMKEGKAIRNGTRADLIRNGAENVSVTNVQELCRQLNKEFEADKVKACSAQLEMRGAAAFLMAVLSYSDFNEAFLRRSIMDILSRNEILLCLRLIIRMRREHDIYRFGPDTTKRAFLWISALCAGLNAPRSPEENRVLQELRAILANERNGVNVLLGFRSFLDSSISGIQEAARQPRGHLSPYQLERLVF
eukprot:scaffold425_cov175-Amphora_coffeaeformis.AAC.24